MPKIFTIAFFVFIFGAIFTPVFSLSYYLSVVQEFVEWFFILLFQWIIISLLVFAYGWVWAMDFNKKIEKILRQR